MTMRGRRRLSVCLALGMGAAIGHGPAHAQSPAPRSNSPGKKTAPTEDERLALVIEKSLQRHGADVHRCFEKALADRLDVAPRVAMEVEVGAEGKVTRAKVLPADGAGGGQTAEALTGCLQEAASHWTIEGIEAGAAVVLPFVFAEQMQQFVVKTEDVPERGPASAGKGGRSRQGGARPAAPFKVKILADAANVHAREMSLTLLTVGPASRVATHRHPRSAKILYLLRGHARVLGPPGTPPLKMDERMALFIPAGYPHAIENMGRQSDAVFLQAFAPAGPERVYRDPADPAARADFEVLRDGGKSTPVTARPVAVIADKVDEIKPPGGKQKVRVLLDAASTGSPVMSLTLREFAPGSEWPSRQEEQSSMVAYVLSGGGKLQVGQEEMPFAADSTLFVPPRQPFAAKFSPGDPTLLIEFLAPAGSEAGPGSTKLPNKPILKP